jgi:NAD(P)-dependent dehydrogenase (short-subunit alcohol dehydrogenase family)
VVNEVRELGVSAIGIKANVGDCDAVNAMVHEACEVFGSVEIAISNVGIRRNQAFLDISPDDWHSVMSTNLEARPTRLTCATIAQCAVRIPPMLSTPRVQPR